MDDLFVRKPGARDGKPNKNTRRSKSVDHRSAPDTFQVLGKGKMHESSRWGNEPDPDSGLVVGVQYSVNKDKRWEGLRDLKKVAEAGETIGDRPIIVVEKVDGDRSAEKQKMQVRDEIEAARKGEYVSQSSLDPRRPKSNMAKSRKGPTVRVFVCALFFLELKFLLCKEKKNVKEEKQVFVKPREGEELVIVVNHSPNAREIRCTKAISSQIPGYMGCGCNLCTGWEDRNRKKKNEELMRNAGL